MRWLDGMSLSKRWEMVKESEARRAAVRVIAELDMTVN